MLSLRPQTADNRQHLPPAQTAIPPALPPEAVVLDQEELAALDPDEITDYAAYLIGVANGQADYFLPDERPFRVVLPPIIIGGEG